MKEFCTAPEPREMAIPDKWTSTEDTCCLKQAVAIKEATIKNGDNGFRFRNESAVDKNNHAASVRA